MVGKGRRDRGTGWAPEPRANPEEKGARGHPPSARSPCAREITPAGGAWPLDEGKRGCRGKLERGLASGPGANPKSGFENQSWHQAARRGAETLISLQDGINEKGGNLPQALLLSHPLRLRFPSLKPWSERG